MRSITLAAAALAASLAGTAVAQPASLLVVEGGRPLAGNQRLVPYGDLQLTSAADRQVLHHRIGLAIADLCDPSHFSVTDPQGPMACAKQAWTDVQPRVGQLTARLASR
ncbi:UrcA family protein [Sphingomonas sp. BN140010]|uniref:UrcA family protein n=1 Tax=Sphingomonas arvum TaxID=2992113 RepID=A0ABT3JG18_9SPHN|nr:UrcA family protein [Sphingomonas sp. BN140010]MCW3798024.1 UrcA family protein [Sphingomonas sp. BN140010]